jgi:hypothetical protein
MTNLQSSILELRLTTAGNFVLHPILHTVSRAVSDVGEQLLHISTVSPSECKSIKFFAKK